MAKTILISGATGLVGQRLAAHFLSKGHIVHALSRKKRPSTPHMRFFTWDLKTSQADPEAFKNISCFIHLAGASIGDKRWTKKRKKQIIQSRIKGLQLAFAMFQKQNAFPKQVIGASAIGYYGNNDFTTKFKESYVSKATDFSSEVCQNWEAETHIFTPHSLVSLIRIGVVLDRNKGALPKLVMPVKYYLAQPLGNGQQPISWIHIKDLIRLIDHVCTRQLEGCYNAVSDQVLSQKEFTQTTARVLSRPFWPIPVPKSILKLILGEQSELVLKGQRVCNEKIKESGFSFQYSTLHDALQNILITGSNNS